MPFSRSVWRQLLLGLALTSSVPAFMLPSQHVLAQVAPRDAADAIDYAIAAGPLGAVLGRFAAASSVVLSFDATLTHGLGSAGLQGRYTVRQGFSQLLQGTGLQVVETSTGYRLGRVPVTAGDGVSVLTPVRVSGRRDPRAQVYETPASVAVITREDIDRLPPRNTSDLLRETAGVFTSQGRGDPGVAINIRGMQDFGRVNVMIDGARQNFQQSGHGSNGQVYVDAALLGGVDIVKGPVSTVGGAGMIAGMVNFRTLDVEDILKPGQRIGGKVDLSTGSNAYHFVGSGVVATRLEDSADLVAAVSRRNIGQFRSGTNHIRDAAVLEHDTAGVVYRESSQSQWSGLLKGTWRPSAGQQVRLSYQGMDIRFDNGIGVQESLSTRGIDTGRRAEQFKVRTDTVKLDYDWDAASPWWSVESGLYYTRTQRRMVREQLVDAGSIAQLQTSFQTETIGGSAQNRARLGQGDIRADWVLGSEFYVDRTRPSMQDFPAASGAANEARWYEGPTPQGRRVVASAFSELDVHYRDWLQVIGGLRYDWYQVSGSGEIYVDTLRNPPGVTPTTSNIYTNFAAKRHGGALAPKLTLAVKPWSVLQLYTSYGQALRPPALTESLQGGMHVQNMFPFYPNPNLREERSRTWELGANLMLDGVLASADRLNVKLSWFHSRVKNFIIPAAVMAPMATQGCYGSFCPSAYVNLSDPATFRGVELQMDYDAGWVFGGVSLSRIQMDLGPGRYDPFPLGSWTGYPSNTMGDGNGYGDDFVGNSIFRGPPKFRLVTQLGVRPWHGKAELGVRYRVELASESDRPFRPQPTRILDLWASWQATDALTLRLAVDNVLDRNYLELAGAGGGFSSGPGRTVIASVSWRF